MFDMLAIRAERLAVRRAAARRARLAARLRERVPADVAIADEGERIVLAGRGLRRRAALEPGLRWAVREVLHER